MMSDVPFIAALCPTFRRPALLANSLALWERQSYPPDRRMLVILDDGQTFDSQAGSTWKLIAVGSRFPSLPAKYNELLRLASDVADAFLVWEDDDIYLPDYVAQHAACLEDNELSKPATVLSDYTGRIAPESAAGRFHSTLGFRRELIERVGGWPPTPRADFDQQFIRRLEDAARSIGDPFADRQPSFVYGWHTGHPHGQSTMRSPDDESWYERAVEFAPPIRVGKLTGQLDDRTRRILGDR